jgi:transketolase
MVSTAAGLAATGMKPWVYSIAPFCYARPFEQIRNDVCLHNLPVRLVGNGAGYGYGVQGPTHHALEDCAAMGALANMQVYAPAFGTDLMGLVDELDARPGPAYVRLGRDETAEGFRPPPWAPWRRLCEGTSGVALVLGGLSATAWEAAMSLPADRRPSLWACCRLPRTAGDLPGELTRQLACASWLMVAEEHTDTGGLGSAIALMAACGGFLPAKLVHLHARGYVSGLYGSQEFHRRECGLDGASLRETMRQREQTCTAT